MSEDNSIVVVRHRFFQNGDCTNFTETILDPVEVSLEIRADGLEILNVRGLVIRSDIVGGDILRTAKKKVPLPFGKITRYLDIGGG